MDGDVRKARHFAAGPHPKVRDKKNQPDGTGKIAEYAKQQIKPAKPPKASCEKKKTVLDVALTPPWVALGVFNHCLRRLFEAAVELVGEPDLGVFTSE